MVTWAEYPKRKCRIPVAGDWQDYPCEVQEWHAGPCATPSVPRTVRVREDWEAANPGWEKLSKFDDPFADIKP